jgi:hypothetical protein
MPLDVVAREPKLVGMTAYQKAVTVAIKKVFPTTNVA